VTDSSDKVTAIRLDHQEKEMDELKVSIDKLNDTIGQMTRTFIAAQVCEQRVAKMEGEQSKMASEQSDMSKAVLLLTANSKAQQESIDKLVPLVTAHEVTVGEVRKLKQLLLGGIGLSALVNPTARDILAKLVTALGGQ
jgi:hypothetical protein